MDNQRKLELTLCGMLPYGLRMKHYDYVYELFGIDLSEQTITLEDEKGNYEQYNELTHWKPLLHSLSKLTEPILDGRLIPIVELAKIAFPVFEWRVIEKHAYSEKNYMKFYYLNLGFRVENQNYDGSIHNQFQLFEKLKEWHFNIYDLPSEMYIEKSTLNPNQDGK